MERPEDGSGVGPDGPPGRAPRDQDETHIAGGVPGPSGTGEMTERGADGAAAGVAGVAGAAAAEDAAVEAGSSSE